MAGGLSLSDFDFDLAPVRIALRPAEPRDAARLLVVEPGAALQDRIVADLPELLRPGDLLVFNDTRVIPARLSGRREREGVSAAVEATLHRRLGPARWSAFVRPAKRLRAGDRIRFGRQGEGACLLGALDATVEARGDGGEATLAFDLTGPALDAAIGELGVMPLPPYIAAQRAEDARDREDYQTVYARADGSVAAPTAGLHFTPELLDRLATRGVERAFVTLHVGAGTFLPVKADAIGDHRMHSEYGEVPADVASAITAARAAGRRVISVGTTSLRLIEAATDEAGVTRPFQGETDIFITPGYAFRAADGLVTNFHLPRSTLMMLVAALAGLETVKAAYAHALAGPYRFYSYGDAGLWFRRSGGA